MKPSQQDFQALEHSQLSHVLALYEEIYLCLRVLMPELQRVEQNVWVSHVPGALDLHLRVLERSRFTTTINLNYCFEPHARASGARRCYEPDLTLRLYHDAQSAEAMSGLLHGVRHEQRQTRSLYGRWRLNRFVLRWLKYLLRKGHGFSPLSHYACLSAPPSKTGSEQNSNRISR